MSKKIEVRIRRVFLVHLARQASDIAAAPFLGEPQERSRSISKIIKESNKKC